MTFVNLFCLALLALLSYGMIDAGIAWYYVIPAALLAFSVLTTITQLVFGISDSLFKKQ